MYPTTRLVVLVTCFVGSLLAYPTYAQEGMKRTILHQADLSGATGMEVISSILEVQPGATIQRHFHHGIEAAYVIEGAMIQDPGSEGDTRRTKGRQGRSAHVVAGLSGN